MAITNIPKKKLEHHLAGWLRGEVADIKRAFKCKPKQATHKVMARELAMGKIAIAQICRNQTNNIVDN